MAKHKYGTGRVDNFPKKVGVDCHTFRNSNPKKTPIIFNLID